jgi:hypothetical protein
VHFIRLGKRLPIVPVCCFERAVFNGEIRAAWTNKYSWFSFLFPGQKIVELEKATLAGAITTFLKPAMRVLLGWYLTC